MISDMQGVPPGGSQYPGSAPPRPGAPPKAPYEKVKGGAGSSDKFKKDMGGSGDFSESPYQTGSSGGGGIPADWNSLVEQIKKETTEEFNKKIHAVEAKTLDFDKRIKDVEGSNKENNERIDSIEKNMKKFLSLYEVVTNQINPFVESPANAVPQKPQEAVSEKKPVENLAEPPVEIAPVWVPKPVIEKEENKVPKDVKRDNQVERKAVIQVSSDGYGSYSPPVPSDSMDSPLIDVREIMSEFRREPELEAVVNPISSNDLLSDAKSILPLRAIKNDLVSLTTVLSWVNYLVERAGTNGTTKILGGYIDLGWITPNAYESLLKYVLGMKGEVEKEYVPTIEDHMKSLFFISSLKGVKLEKSEFDILVKRWGRDLNGR